VVTPVSEREDLKRWDREIVWHAFTQMAEYEPLLIERAQGCTLIDVEGRRYLDGVSSLWCNVHGHRHPHIDAAVRAQLERVAHVTSLGLSNPTTIRLAKKLVDVAPEGLNHVFFSDSGATAVEVALKLAFQYWRQCPQPEPRRTKYLAFDAAYHGDTLGSVSVGGVARFHAMFSPLLFDVVRVPAPRAHGANLPVATEQLCAHYLGLVEQALKAHAGEIAAMVIEPLVQCAAGMLMHPPGFLEGLRDLTRDHRVLLIADEVAVGMGRTGTLFACEQEQVSPDLLCLAKGLTGGYLPVAATLATTEIWNAFLGPYEESRSFFHGHTYGGNPLGCAAALATLEVFEQEQTLQQMTPKIARLGEHLARLAELPHVGNCRQRGLIAGIDLVRDKSSGELFPWEQKVGLAVCREALARGVWLRPLGSTLVVMPPLAITMEELDRLCEVLELSIRRVFHA
jgi:adenosylmethionine-8-amino-7-oxononanoate aminotransferase